MTDFEVRPATVEDCDELGALHVQCCRQTYTQMPDEWWETFTPQDKADNWRSVMATGARPLLATVDGRLVGFAGAGPTLNREHVVNGAPRELYVLYVLQEFHGTGIGQALLDAALEPGRAQLWVGAENARAIAFYQRNGFLPDGAVDAMDEVYDGMPQIRLVRRD